MTQSWTLRSEIQGVLGISQELWGSLMKIGDPRSAVAAWELILKGEGLRDGELLEALRIWAKGSDGSYPPRPGNLLEIAKRERVARVHRRELDAWRAAGMPTIALDGTVTRLEIETGDAPTSRRGVPKSLPTVRKLALPSESKIRSEATQRSNEALKGVPSPDGAEDA